MYDQLGRETKDRTVTAALLHRIPFFREVPEGALAPLVAVSSRQVLGHGNTLWEPDDAIEAVVVLAAGVVRLYRYLNNGEEVTVALLNHGQICGLASLDDAFTPTTVAQALFNETVVYRISRRPFAAFLLANPAVALRALNAACRRVQDAYDLCALPDARARVAYPTSSRTWRRPAVSGRCGRRTRNWRFGRTFAVRRSQGICCQTSKGVA